MPKDEVFAIFESSVHGLSDKEVEKRRLLFGENVITEKRRMPAAKLFFRQFKSLLVMILVAAFGVTVLLQEWLNAAVIAAAVLANAALGFWQENKAENVLELLRTYIRARVKVRRGGYEQEIDAVELVPGDVMLLSPGDRVSADARLIHANHLEADEAVITGESMPAWKEEKVLSPSIALPDRRSMVFGGTLITQGVGEAVVVATANDTEFGKIAGLLEKNEREITPLERAIADFAKITSVVLFIFVLLLFSLGIAFGQNIYDMFLITVAVAVSAVPEGLPIALTVILAVGVERLARRKGIVRKLLAAETLGSASIILTDKTGTLTQAKMEVADVAPYGASVGEAEKAALVKKALANVNVIVEETNGDISDWRFVGSSLESALVRFALAEQIMSLADFRALEAIDRLPFSSAYKFSASRTIKKEKHTMFLLGAPEILLSFTDLDDEEKGKIESEILRRARNAERVVGVAERDLLPEEDMHGSNARAHCRFLGLISFRDPLRLGVKAAIAAIGRAGVKTVIVTGDHPGTAEAVARELGLVDGKGAVLTGDDLQYLTHEELRARAAETTVFARVTPEQKMMLVELFQERGEVVAVTGDGVNDAPALARADIGIAVGFGTDVTKQAADLVVLDNNFETIVAAIFEGRKIVGNMRKVIVYLFSSVLDELFLVGGSLIFGLALPLSALQILFVNFFSDSFPAIAFAFEDGVDDHAEHPRKIGRTIMDPAMRMFIFVIGIGTSVFLFAIYYALLALEYPLDLAQSFIFASFASYTLILAFSLRSLEKSIFKYNPFSNKYLNGGVFMGLAFTLSAIYVPFLQSIFHTVPLPPVWLAGVFAVWILNILVVEAGKYIIRVW